MYAQVAEGVYTQTTSFLVDSVEVNSIESTCIVSHIGDSTYVLDCNDVTGHTDGLFVGNILYYGRQCAYYYNIKYNVWYQQLTPNVISKVTYKQK